MIVPSTHRPLYYIEDCRILGEGGKALFSGVCIKEEKTEEIPECFGDRKFPMSEFEIW